MFAKTVSALCSSISSQRAAGAAKDPALSLSAPYDDVAEYVLKQHAQMTDYLRFPLLVLTLVFAFCGFFYGLAPFHFMSEDRRLRQVEAWRKSRLGPFRDLIKFYESLSVVALYSRKKR